MLVSSSGEELTWNVNRLQREDRGMLAEQTKIQNG